MARRSSIPVVLVLTLAGYGWQADAGQPPRTPGRASRFELATRGDLLLSHLVDAATAGDVEVWSKTLLGGLPGQVGDWVSPYFDARTMASIIAETFPVEGQPALAPVDRLVESCSATLGITKPAVHVRNNPMPRIYAVRSGDRHHLIITSALLNLFEGRPDELRFFVGRELGHIKCGHDELRRKSYAVLSAVQAINAAVVPDRYQNVLPTLALGRLFTWCRESEFSADRAGLICAGTPKAAYEAIMRMQHGLRADSPWIDPAAPEFDTQSVIRQFQDWQYQPFVKFVLHVREQPLDHPYYQERLASLREWADTDSCRMILGRQPGSGADRLIEIVSIRAHGLAGEGLSVDPYVIASDERGQILRTRHATGVTDGEWDGFRPTDPGTDQPRAMQDGQPLFFEIWDANYGYDDLIGGFVVYPVAGAEDGEAEYTAKIRWDWREPSSVARPGHATVRVRFSHRTEPKVADIKKEKSR